MNYHPLASRILKTAIFVAFVVVAASASAEVFYQLESATVLSGNGNPEWDYLTFDQARSRLFIARRHDGVSVYDAKARKIISTIEDSFEGNAIRLVPEHDRGFVINQDGSATVFVLSTLVKLDRVKFGDDADNCFYDPVTKQLMVTMGDSHQVAFLDGLTGRLMGKLQIDSAKLEGAAPDGKGNLFLALRDRNKIIRINVAERKITAEWPTEGCEVLSGLDYDPVNQRIFVGGRGNDPVLAVMDAISGRVVARPSIGRGNDTVIFDPATRRIYTSNGGDGTLVVIQQVDADTYKLAEAATTRPYAKTMAFDFSTKKVYTVTAEGTVNPAKPWHTNLAPFYPNKFFPGTFVILTYSPR
jgi:DNA-binding beta-propeller fold protein YncE